MGEMKRFLLCGLRSIAGFVSAALGWFLVNWPIAYLIERMFPGGHSDLSLPSEQRFCFGMFFLGSWPFVAFAGLFCGRIKTEAYLDSKYPRRPQAAPRDKIPGPTEPEPRE